jgi:hypothetical protein
VFAAAFLAVSVGCGSDAEQRPSPDAGLDGAFDTGTHEPDGTDADGALSAVLEAPRYAETGDSVALDATASSGATSFDWTLPDATDVEVDGGRVTARWLIPGRYRVSVEVVGEDGATDRAMVLLTVVPPRTFAPRRSGSLAAVGSDGIAVVEADAGSLSLFGVARGETPELRWRTETCVGGRNVAAWRDSLVVSCPDEDRIVIHAAESGAQEGDLALPWGSRPFGVVADEEGRLIVALQGRGTLAVFEKVDGEQVQRVLVPTVPDPRGLALLPGGRVAVTRWRSPDERGEIDVIDLADGERERLLTLAFDPVRPSDTESGGVPSYLDSVAMSPSGLAAVVPHLQANVGHGEYLSGETLTFETTVRAALSVLDIEAGEEFFEARRLFDNRGLASSAVFSPWGDYVFVTMRGARSLERLDVFTLYSQSGAQLDVGFAPDGLGLSPDGAFVVVHAPLSREIVVYDVDAFGPGVGPVARLSTVDSEPLEPEVLRGKRLFNDAFDGRLGKDSYIACAHCHLDGEADRRTWDFTDRGEGLRNTIDLQGRAGLAHGPVHWSANFDEIQDFEHDIRGPFSGLGLMDDAAFHAELRDTPLGGAKAGVSEDLDALAAYVASLSSYPRSPHRSDDGSLTDSGERGRELFESEALDCTSCHAGEHLTDSAMVDGSPVLHDVGTMTEASGSRLGAALPGLDTPTLRGLWNSPPYLHDGSAPTVRAVFEANDGDAHGVTSGLSSSELDDLAEYLLSLE